MKRQKVGSDLGQKHEGADKYNIEKSTQASMKNS